MMKRIFVLIYVLLSHYNLQAEALKIENYKRPVIEQAVSYKDLIPEGVNAVCIKGNTLFCGSGHRVYALDVTDPMRPELISYIELSGYMRQMVLQGEILYVAARETGVWILNISDPKQMKLLSRYDAVELATGIDVAGEVMFLAMRQNGVEFVDVSDPTNPTHIRLEKTNESQSVFYHDGYLYSGEWRGHHVTTIYAGDMADVKTMTTSNLEGYGDGIWAHGKHLYASTGLHSTRNQSDFQGNGHGLEIFSISDKAAPELLSRIDFPVTPKKYPDYWTPRPCNDGKYVVCADTHNGVFILDCRKKSSPEILSNFSIVDENSESISVTTVEVGKGVIYVGTHSPLGVVALQCPDIVPVVRDKGKLPINYDYRYPYETSANSHFVSWKPEMYAPVRGVAATDSLLYAACCHGGLAILAKDADGNIIQVGHGPMDYAGDVKVQGDKLIVAEGYDGFAVYQIGTDLKEIARYNGFELEGEKSLCFWVFAPDDRHIVASTRLHGYYYFDLSNLPEIKKLGKLGRGPGWDRYVSDKADSQGWYPRLWHNSGPYWSNLNAVSEGETKDNGFKTTLFDGVCLYKNDSFVTCSGGKMYIYRFNEIGKPRVGIGQDMYGAPAWDGSNTIGLTARIDRIISKVMMSDKENPQLLWSEETDGFPETGTFWNGMFVVPCGHQGILIEK